MTTTFKKENADLILSARALNVCDNKKLISVKDLLDYFFKKGNFLGLKNSGNKTNLELLTFCGFIENDPALKRAVINEKIRVSNLVVSKAYHGSKKGSHLAVELRVIDLVNQLLSETFDPLQVHELFVTVNKHLSISQEKLLTILNDNTPIHFCRFPGKYYGRKDGKYNYSSLANSKEYVLSDFAMEELLLLHNLTRQEVMNHYLKLGYRDAQIRFILQDLMEKFQLFWDKYDRLQIHPN